MTPFEPRAHADSQQLRVRRYSLMAGCLFVVIVGTFTAIGVLRSAAFRRIAPMTSLQSAAQPPLPTARIRVNGTFLTVERATAPEQQQQGLSFRKALTDDGMLFVFPTSEVRTFWMRGMRFPLDIVFIQDGFVLNVTANVPAPSKIAEIPSIVSSAAQADAVLELRAGRAAELGIQTGTFVWMER